MERVIQRVLVACRGEEGAAVARRIEAAGYEAVALYADADAGDAWIDEVAYAVRIATDHGDPYADGLKIVSAALDAGCDAVHPGTAPVAGSAEVAHMVLNVGLAWIGAPPVALQACAERAAVRAKAKELAIPTIAASPPLASRAEIDAWIAKLGGDVRVASCRRGAPAWTGQEPLDAGLRRLGEPVVVERRLAHARHVVVGFVADAGGNVLLLGDHERSLARGRRVRVRESPAPALDATMRGRLGETIPRLVAALGVAGVGAVEVLVGEDGRWWLHDVVPGLIPGFALHEEVYGLELVHTQVRLAAGETLGWRQDEIRPAGCGIALTLTATGPGTLEALELPEGGSTALGEGSPVDPARDPVLARLMLTGPMRQALLVRARAALEEVGIDGVAHDTDALAALLADTRVWGGATETDLFEGA